MEHLRAMRSPLSIAFCILIFLSPGSMPKAYSESARALYRRGQAAETRGEMIAAYNAYKAAHDLKPSETRYKVSYERIRVLAAADYVRQGETYMRAGSQPAALAAYLKALDVDPGNELAEQDTRKLQESLQRGDRAGQGVAGALAAESTADSPARLDISAGDPITLHMIEDSKIIYQALGKEVGINVLFDPEYNSKRIQIDLKGVTSYEALNILGQVSDTFWKPVTHNTIFVAQDNRAKRQAFSEQAIQVFYLRNVTQQSDFTEVQTALRNVFQTARINGIASENAIMMRGTPDELQLAKMLISSLDQPKPEVLVDITVMEVSRDKLREIGLSPPTSLTVNSGSSQTLNEIGKSSSYSISIGQAAVDFLLTDSDTRVIQSPRLRAADGQKATLKLGEKLPIATGSYTVATSSTSSAAETQFQYVDVGVNVEMTPAIHSDRDVTLKLSVEVSSESGTETIEGVAEPVIAQEKSDQVVRLKDGEATILAGLTKKQVAQTVSGWPGFGEIPFVKYFFTTQSHQVTTDELVFMIVPHIVRASPFDSDSSREIDTGTDRGIQLRRTMPISTSAQPDRHQ
jgi:general secretion pathway protein D